MTYIAVKHSHLLLVGMTLILFNLRYALRVFKPQQALPRWLKVAPHLNDTLLLLTGLWLIYLTRWIPFANAPWLGVKLLLLLLYIACGMAALKSAPRSGRSVAGFAAAWLCIASMVALAWFKPPLW